MKVLLKYLVFVFVMLTSSCGFLSSGSYPDAEYYIFNTSINSLVNQINDFKSNNPEYKLYRMSSDGVEVEVPDEYERGMYELYFYLKDTNQTIHCIIKSVKGNAKIELISFSYGKNFAGWKHLNTKEISKDDSKLIKNKFENDILNKLGDWERQNKLRDAMKNIFGS